MMSLLANQEYIGALMFVLAAVMAIVLHELAHGYAAILNGDLTAKYNGRMTINPAKHFDPIGFLMFMFVGFGWAKPVPVNASNFKNYRRGMFQVSIAGVLTNFLIAFLIYPLYRYSLSNLIENFGNIYWHSLYYFSMFAFLLNLSLCVFNLLPIYPLDGFRLIESQARYGNRFVEFMYRYGIFVFIGFLLVMNFTDYNLLSVLRNYISYPIVVFWRLFGL